MLVNPDPIEDVAPVGDKPHLVRCLDSKVIIPGEAVDACAGAHIFIVDLEPQAATFDRVCRTIRVSVKRSCKVLPIAILEDGVVVVLR